MEVILLGKMKIHELAKKLNLNSKEVLERAKELNINVKSHLSAIEDEDVAKIEASYQTSSKKEEKPVKETKQEKAQPVIIRREVIITDEELAKKQEEEKRKKQERAKQDIGFVHNERKKDFNIVYRDKKTKPLTVNELFGIKPEKKEPVEQKTVAEPIEKEEKTIETKPEPIVEEKKEAPQRVENHQPDVEKTHVSLNNQQNHVNRNNENQANRTNQSFNRNNYNRNNQNGYNRNNQNGFRRENNQQGNYNRNNQQGYRNNQGFNRNNNQNNFNRNNQSFGRRPLDEKGIEKNIKNIMSAEIVEKENVREYSNKAIDKQKNREKEEARNKKQGKVRRNGDFDSIDTDKLKKLKQESKLSHMFNEGSMLDYYDLSDNRNRKNKKKLQKQEENHVKQKIFKLTDITIPDTITVKDLAAELKKTTGEVIKKLLGYGILATINNELDFDTAFLIAGEFGVTAHKKETVTEEDILFDESEDKVEELEPRPPVVVVMGHVDHGKN